MQGKNAKACSSIRMAHAQRRNAAALAHGYTHTHIALIEYFWHAMLASIDDVPHINIYISDYNIVYCLPNGQCEQPSKQQSVMFTYNMYIPANNNNSNNNNNYDEMIMGIVHSMRYGMCLQWAD